MFFIGMLGDPYQVAAISLVSPVFVLLMAAGTLIGCGGCAAIARSLGNKETDAVKSISAKCFVLSLGIGLVIGVGILISLDFWAGVLGADTITWDFTKNYLGWLAAGAPVIIFTNAFSNIIRAEGAAKEAMIGNAIATLTNIVLDPLFILVLGMGVSGTAIATVIGNMVGAVYLFIYCNRKDTALSLNPKLAFKAAGQYGIIVSLGLSSAVGNLMMSVAGTLQNRVVISYGADTVAALSAGGKAVMLVVMVVMGICMGVQPAISYNYGRGNVARTREILRKTLLVSTAVSLVLTVVCFLGSGFIVGMFLRDTALIELGVRVAHVHLLSQPLLGLFFLGTNFLQSAGNALYSSLLSVTRQVLVLMPVFYILNAFMGLNGIIIAPRAADVIAVVVSVWLGLTQFKRFKRNALSSAQKSIEQNLAAV
jgi:putative MATE family efflux protein